MLNEGRRLRRHHLIQTLPVQLAFPGHSAVRFSSNWGALNTGFLYIRLLYTKSAGESEAENINCVCEYECRSLKLNFTGTDKQIETKAVKPPHRNTCIHVALKTARHLPSCPPHLRIQCLLRNQKRSDQIYLQLLGNYRFHVKLRKWFMWEKISIHKSIISVLFHQVIHVRSPFQRADSVYSTRTRALPNKNI